MTDRILINDLLLRAIIGINEDERRNRQDVLINVVLHVDTRKPGASDNIEHAVNYRTITKRIIELVESSQFYLVEKLAAEIATSCLEEPQVERALVRVEKPGALRFARSVGVEIERSKSGPYWPNQAFISLGSNIDPERNLPEAVRRLSTRGQILAVSRVYETAPVGKTDQPNFLNAAVQMETELSAAALKDEVLRAIEQELGRVRTQNKNAPRTIDLDISLFNDEVLDAGNRHIPDPEIVQRAYLAWPLADLAPDYRHPETGQTLLQIAQALPDTGLLRRVDLTLELESPQDRKE